MVIFTVNLRLKAIWGGKAPRVGRSMNMYGGFKYSTWNWVLKNSVPLLTSWLGFEPPIQMLLGEEGRVSRRGEESRSGGIRTQKG